MLINYSSALANAHCNNFAYRLLLVMKFNKIMLTATEINLAFRKPGEGGGVKGGSGAQIKIIGCLAISCIQGTLENEPHA